MRIGTKVLYNRQGNIVVAKVVGNAPPSRVPVEEGDEDFDPEDLENNFREEPSDHISIQLPDGTVIDHCSLAASKETMSHGQYVEA